MKTRAIILGILLLFAGIIIFLTPISKGQPKNENWLASHAPINVGGYRFRSNQYNTPYSYKLSDSVYDTLNPDAILTRVYQKGDKSYDVILILSRNRESFHDQRVCFSAQGWTIEKLEAATISTKSAGLVPVTLVKMNSQQERGKLAALFYKGNSGFYGNPQKFKFSLILDKLKGISNVEGTFIRIMPTYSNPDPEEFKKFISDYIDAANISSHGYY